VLEREYEQSRDYYQSHPEAALQLLDVGQPPATSKVAPDELASWMVVASMIFNLDEAITHE
jgi:hypothetical protein